MSKIYRDDVISIALGEVGYCEKASDYDLDSKTGNAGHNNYTKYARDLWNADPHFYQGPKQGYDWCAVFVDWCIYEATGRDSVYAQAASSTAGLMAQGVSLPRITTRRLAHGSVTLNRAIKCFSAGMAHTSTPGLLCKLQTA